MPPRTAPTARQQRLGAELRKMRERAGMNAPQAADQLGTNRTGISNIEAGRFGVSAERVRSLARIYECADQAYVDALAAMAEERGKGWWEEYRGTITRGALDLAELEHHARSLRSVQIMHMPGLLQTEDYAKAVLSTAAPAPSPVELRRRLSFRMRRRDVLDKKDGLTCMFLIHEAAMRMEFGGPKVTRHQLEYVLEASERSNITVRAVPFSAGGFPNAGTSTKYAAGPVPQLDTIHLDVANGNALLDTETHLANHRFILDHTEKLSLDPKATRDFLRAIAQEL
ncbi:helix-turn-helix domain-containing protein [Streptomyces sp. AV19]|uniref:Scr1 family TA system antitoxin-like transcriptional regulator n=1 Tax=Streptomyces sp. AV19 TaxID=2793068 RepID=UPI0018FEBBC5|nr:Scr1 family TA system antitoxin-like transcriptional regulator [Streptomyces sp. AV19]MBH1936142.1 helix-turn-helix domain-containing protein [Streptomyces sp. AV19]MDG4534062.1 Scr1 family TA system antitoxin-like transcriptional regulator [Streptomyces sp. AV19]